MALDYTSIVPYFCAWVDPEGLVGGREEGAERGTPPRGGEVWEKPDPLRKK